VPGEVSSGNMVHFWLLACRSPIADDAVTAPTTESSADTGSPLPPGEPEVCRVSDANALRVVCTATFAAPGSATVTLTDAATGRVRTFDDPTVLATHELIAWGLTPETEYRWTFSSSGGEVLSGSVTTGPLPVQFSGLVLHAESLGSLVSGVDALLIPSSCPLGYLLLVDVDGRVLWYQSVSEATGGLASSANAVTWTERGTVLFVGSRTVVGEITPTGEVVFTAVSGDDFEDVVHHDVFERDGFIYVPQAREEVVDGTSIVVDRILAFDLSGVQVDELDTLGLYPYASAAWMIGGYWAGRFLGALDFTHTNSVFVDVDGGVWVSFRHLHAIAKFTGGPGTDAFGTLEWTAVGDDSSPIFDQGDFALDGTIDPSFSGQHDVHRAADGTMLLLDNGLPAQSPARAVRYAIDEQAATLTAVAEWPVGSICPTQGSVRELPNGNLVVACPLAGSVQEFTATGDPVWELEATCGDIVAMPITRAIPVAL
jgi:Arylsulfotransferase (ASST)